MNLYFILLNILLSFVLTAINLTEFFLLISLIMMYKEVSFLKPFATAGKDIVTGFTTFTNNLTKRLTGKTLSDKGSIVTGIVILELLRLTAGLILC